MRSEMVCLVWVLLTKDGLGEKMETSNYIYAVGKEEGKVDQEPFSFSKSVRWKSLQSTRGNVPSTSRFADVSVVQQNGSYLIHVDSPSATQVVELEKELGDYILLRVCWGNALLSEYHSGQSVVLPQSNHLCVPLLGVT
jgi:hypothetical protein